MSTISMDGLRPGRRGTIAGTVLAAIAFIVIPARGASAQAADPNPGALTFSAAFDVPTLYLFRGLRQEIDPSLTMWPYADLRIDLSAGDGAVKSTAINFGVWNSLHTGSSGTDGSSEKLHYEEDFYSAFTLGFGGATSFTTQFTAYTSPNAGFTTVKEISLKLAQASRFAPYGLLAFEVGGDGTGQADVGQEKGVYLELGVGPSWPLGGSSATIAIPLKLGMSLKDYYELNGTDHKFGYFDYGVLFTFPWSSAPTRFGTWNFHAGLDGFVFGDTTESFNINKDGDTSSSTAVALFGVGVTY